MAFCCSSSSSSSSDDLAAAAVAANDREAALQMRLDQMRRERQSELKQIGRLVADATAVSPPQSAIDDRENAAAASSNRHSTVQRLFENRLQRAEPAEPVIAPTSIRVEVIGLSQLRPVSRILQSSAFRTELESLVRASLSPRQPTQRPAPVLAAPEHRPVDQQEPQQQQQQPQQQQDRSITELRRQRHEELVQEINELLHSQLVSGGLDGAFRARLERELRSRAAALPDGGRRAQTALQRLPPSGVQRNDFSHLGIWQQQQQQGLEGPGDFLDDSASSAEEVLSAVSTAAVNAAVSQSTVAVTRQLHSVQRELTDVRRTLRLLLGNQLETQRMIRQEVAAALAANSGSIQPTVSLQSQPPTASIAGACLICLTNRADTVMYRCGHLCMCTLCTARMREAAPGGRMCCPVCRAPVADTMRVFAASADRNDNQE